MGFNAELNVSAGWNWGDGVVDSGRLGCAQRLSEGNGANQAEAVWHVENQELPDGESITLDLTDLARVVLGDLHTVGFLSIRGLLIVSSADAAGRLLIGGAANDAWSAPFGAAGDRVVLSPESPLLLANRQTGWSVDQTHRLLKLSADGGAVEYSIVVIGTVTAGDSGSGE